MSEMLLRVAKAIAEKQHQSWLYNEEACRLCDPRKLAVTREHLMAAASAAINAMREPTRSMLDAAATVERYTEPGAEWGPMIAAALQ